VLVGALAGRKLEDLIVVDNLICNFINHPKQCIPIKDFEGQRDDQVLKSLTRYMMSLRDVSSVPEKIAADFYDHYFK